MRTTTLIASRSACGALFSLLVSSMGCAQLGHPGGHRSDGPDAGTVAATCDQVETKTMDMTFAGSDMSYAGLPTSCWKLAGKLTIMGSVASLAKLGDLREVQDLEINAGALTTIDTAGDLKVTRNINIHDTTKLVDLGKLVPAADATCLTYMTSVSIVGNSALTDLKNLKDITCVSGAVTIQNNVSLASISLEHAIRIEGGVTIQDNTKLTSVSMLSVQSVTHGSTLDAITIRHNAALTTINFNDLKYLHGSLTIDNNASLASIASMTSTFPAIEGYLYITGNTKLTDLGTLDHSPGALDGITITGNTALPYCQARHVGCCVDHPGTAQIGQGNTNCGSWCTDQHNCYSTTN